MNKELETIKSFQNKRVFDVTYDNGTQKHFETKTIGELFPDEINKIETELKALEIIKSKRNFLSVEYHEDKDKYYLYSNTYFSYVEITKEEYDLLNEVFDYE